jgi:hypothetical protein
MLRAVRTESLSTIMVLSASGWCKLFRIEKPRCFQEAVYSRGERHGTIRHAFGRNCVARTLPVAPWAGNLSSHGLAT